MTHDTYQLPDGSGTANSSTSDVATSHRLGEVALGTVGHIAAIVPTASNDRDVERRLLELGFLEGERVEVLHEGPLQRDPIAVRVGAMTIALRRREAMAVIVTVNPATDA